MFGDLYSVIDFQKRVEYKNIFHEDWQKTVCIVLA